MDEQEGQDLINKPNKFIQWFKDLFKPNTIDINLPKGFSNCVISTENRFYADTNNGANWDTLDFPLPTPKNRWCIKCYSGDINNPQKRTITLIDQK